MFIEIKDARKHYGEGETLVNALDGVSLSDLYSSSTI